MWNIYLIQSSEETADENRAQNRNIFTDVYFLSFNEVVFKSTLMWVENTTKIHAEVEAVQEKPEGGAWSSAVLFFISIFFLSSAGAEI